MFEAEFREDIQVIIPIILGGLKDPHWYAHEGSVELLSRLAAQGMC